MQSLSRPPLHMAPPVPITVCSQTPPPRHHGLLRTRSSTSARKTPPGVKGPRPSRDPRPGARAHTSSFGPRQPPEPQPPAQRTRDTRRAWAGRLRPSSTLQRAGTCRRAAPDAHPRQRTSRPRAEGLPPHSAQSECVARRGEHARRIGAEGHCFPRRAQIGRAHV